MALKAPKPTPIRSEAQMPSVSSRKRISLEVGLLNDALKLIGMAEEQVGVKKAAEQFAAAKKSVGTLISLFK